MKKLNSILLLVSLLSFGASAVADTDVGALIDKAEQTRLQAVAAGFEWTATEGLINSAREALQADKSELATTLTNKALKQAENGLKQAKYADEHWQEYLP